jgi:carboxyl-terminal processing protease
MRNSRNESVLLLVGLTVLVLLAGNFFQGLLFAETADRFEHLEWFADAFDKIDKEFVEEIPPDKLIEGAIDGMTGALDRYSAFLSREHLKQLEEDTSGEYVGVGIRIFEDDDKLITVDSTFPGSPAFREGILAGDKIISVEGKSTRGMTTAGARDLIRGPQGTTVELGMFRPATEDSRSKELVVNVLREKIDISSIDTPEIVAPGIGFIHIKEFSDQTADDLRREIERMVKKDNIEGLIIDLRWNPGGLLRSAVDVSDMFMPKGQVVVGTKGRLEGEGRTWSTDSPDRYPDIKLAVLTNEFSASASEIVAGALHDTGRARLFGAKTFGKGSVQTVIELKNNTALKLTTARYYTPKGTLIEESGGIEPDLNVPVGRDEMARLMQQMRLKENGAMVKLVEKQQALEDVALYTKDHVGEVVQKLYDEETTLESVREWLNEHAKNSNGSGVLEDRQLQAAVRWLQGKEDIVAEQVEASVTEPDTAQDQ